jgi:hypothetical protein
VSLIAVYAYMSDSSNVFEEPLYNTRKSVFSKQIRIFECIIDKTELHTESVLQNCRQQ